jgi:hypothetical protein
MNAKETDPRASSGAVMETIGITEAAQLLRMSESALMRKARVGKVPGAKIGRRWVFVQAYLVELIREQARQRTGRPIAAATLRVDASSTMERSASQLAREIKAKRKQLLRRPQR